MHSDMAAFFSLLTLLSLLLCGALCGLTSSVTGVSDDVTHATQPADTTPEEYVSHVSEHAIDHTATYDVTNSQTDLSDASGRFSDDPQSTQTTSRSTQAGPPDDAKSTESASLSTQSGPSEDAQSTQTTSRSTQSGPSEDAQSTQTASRSTQSGPSEDTQSTQTTSRSTQSGPSEDAQSTQTASRSTQSGPSEDTQSTQTTSRSTQSGPSEDAQSTQTASRSNQDTTSKPTVIENTATAQKGLCDAVLCENGNGLYFLNSSACSENNLFTLDPSNVSSIEIRSDDAENGANQRDCQWEMAVPLQSVLSVTVERHSGDLKMTNFELTMTQDTSENGYNQTLSTKVVRGQALGNSSVSFNSILRKFSHTSITIKHRFLQTVPPARGVLTLHYSIHKDPELPKVNLSASHGYVTSPLFEEGNSFPKNYSIQINIGRDESVVTRFEYMYLDDTDSGKNYLELSNSANEINQTLRGHQKNVPLQIFRSSLHLHFHASSISKEPRPGFKMLFAVVARSDEPQVLASGLVDCSAPHYRGFEPLLACNMLPECLGEEDERNCSYRSQGCGADAVDVGTKCLEIIQQSGNRTWFDAKNKCVRRNGSLPTFETSEEFRLFQLMMTNSSVSGKDVYIGALAMNRLGEVTTRHMYRNVWQWRGSTTAFALQSRELSSDPICSKYRTSYLDLYQASCYENMDAQLVCEFAKNGVSQPAENAALDKEAGGLSVMNPTWKVNVIRCTTTAGHVTRDFLSCDSDAKCQSVNSDGSCTSGGVTVPMFTCQQSGVALSYSLVCDHIQHCPDNSDEDFCKYPECAKSLYWCDNGQCYSPEQRCDGNLDCYDGMDEASCWNPRALERLDHIYPPASIHMDGTGGFTVKSLSDSGVCPLTHFHCPGGFCLPVYLRCNGIDDCPGREDEAGCDIYDCPGFYRCHGSTVCLHADDVCDGVPQCPRLDDELLCHLDCPEGCRCSGLASVCNATTNGFIAASNDTVRYLDSCVTLAVENSHFLVHLRSSRCGFDTVSLELPMPNLRELDLSWNQLVKVDMHPFTLLKNLRVLLLTGNPLVEMTMSTFERMILERLDLSYTLVEVYNSSVFTNNHDLTTLNMSHTKLNTIMKDGFKTTPLLKNLDLSGSPLNRFPGDLLLNLDSLKTVRADNYKLCCEAMLPKDFKPENCHAPQDLLASCDDLLRSSTYRVALWTLASLSLVGNAGSLGARLYLHRRGDTLGSFGVFVLNLSVADFVMGVYLAIVGVADNLYRGKYLWRDDEWKTSAGCKTAGFLSLLSSEVSAFMICLITLDRFLVISFPFSRFRFGRWSALVTCGLVWFVGIVLAAVPLLPMTSHWEFYSQTGICTPLPFTGGDSFKGYAYSFNIMIVLNLVLFLLIAAGQAAIYWSIRAKSVPSSGKTRARDATIARRLTTVVVSDFLCWFPIGLLGLLAATGTPIPGELNVAVAIFVLPFNSALNPFLYTFNVIAEQRRKTLELSLKKRWETSAMDMSVKQTPEPVDKAAAILQVKTLGRRWKLTPEDVFEQPCTCNCKPPSA